MRGSNLPFLVFILVLGALGLFFFWPHSPSGFSGIQGKQGGKGKPGGVRPSSKERSAPMKSLPLKRDRVLPGKTLSSPLKRSPAIPRPRGGPGVHGIGRRGPRPAAGILFPDGTWLLPLNGVKKAPPFPGFPPDRPYAPVVSIHRSTGKGLSWYIHSDGSRSTVQMVRREKGGKIWYEAGWVVGTPVKAQMHPKRQGQTSPSKAGSSIRKK